MMPKKNTGPKKKHADQLFSKVIRVRDKVCVKCGRPDQLQCAHIFSRGYTSTRWDERNAVALCAGHHVWFTHHPIEWEQFVVGLMGQEAYDALKLDAIKLAGPTDYKRLCARLTERLQELEAG